MSLEAQVTEALSPGGRLAMRWPGYEQRDAQLALAGDLARTIARGGVLLAEAPTGIGKSVAYLLPAVLHARATGERVLIATATRSLQDQLVERDLPALLTALGESMPFACLKGKQNYVCTRALEMASGEGAEEEEVIEDLRAWAAADDVGDLDRFPAPDAESFRRVRARVATDPSSCSGATCRRARECFWARARRRASEVKLVVVNHALLARAAEADGMLPDPDVLIVDEAHRLEGVLSAQLERSVSRHRIEELFRLMGALRGGRRAGGLLSRARTVALPLLESGVRREGLHGDLERLAARIEEARADFEALFSRLVLPAEGAAGPYGRRARHRSMEDLLGRDLQPLEVALEHASVFADALLRASTAVMAADAGAVGEELASELELVSARWRQLGDDLTQLAGAEDRAWVYWRSQSREAKQAELRGAPVWVGEHARRLVLARPRAVVLTSATLASDGDFGWLAERLGLADGLLPHEAVSHPSPFELARQMRCLVYDGEGDEVAIVTDVVSALARETGRNILVLLTAHERMRRVRRDLAARLPGDVPLAAQDVDGPAGLLAERFRGTRGGVLLGVQSLWEGVDFPGEALEVLVVAKLPFSVPDDPLVEARGERLRELGRDPFRHDAVPEAVVRFRQGVGRLIRRGDDRGVLVVCDPRLMNARYRKPFLAALPNTPELHRDAQQLALDAARFLGRPAARPLVEDPS